MTDDNNKVLGCLGVLVGLGLLYGLICATVAYFTAINGVGVTVGAIFGAIFGSGIAAAVGYWGSRYKEKASLGPQRFMQYLSKSEVLHFTLILSVAAVVIVIFMTILVVRSA